MTSSGAATTSRPSSSTPTPTSTRSGSSSDSGYVPPPPPQRVVAVGPSGAGGSGARPVTDADDEANDSQQSQQQAVDDSDLDEEPADPLSSFGPAGGSTGLGRASSMAQRKMDEYPDPTLSNRRPPYLSHRPQPIRHASGGGGGGGSGGGGGGGSSHAGPSAFACADRFVAIGGFGLRVYDAESAGLELVCRLDQREAGLDVRSDKARISALCFLPPNPTRRRAAAVADGKRGEANRWLWAGTSDGHLFEVDVWSSVVTQVKPAVHHHHHHHSHHASSSSSSSMINGGGGSSSSSSSNALSGAEITHIWSSAGRMLVYDESGRAALYTADPEDGRFYLGQPSAIPRLADRQSFAVLLAGGQVWTSAGPAGSSSSGTATSTTSVRANGRSPAIRVYEPFASITDGGGGNGTVRLSTAGRVLAVPDSVTGAILCGTVLPSQPSLAYFGHEGGLISSWDRTTLSFVGAVKVGTTAVTSLAGVGDRLWAGSRKGLVSVYDVETRPWTVTNMWAAHEYGPLALYC